MNALSRYTTYMMGRAEVREAVLDTAGFGAVLLVFWIGAGALGLSMLPTTFVLHDWLNFFPWLAALWAIHAAAFLLGVLLCSRSSGMLISTALLAAFFSWLAVGVYMSKVGYDAGHVILDVDLGRTLQFWMVAPCFWLTAFMARGLPDYIRHERRKRSCC